MKGQVASTGIDWKWKTSRQVNTSILKRLPTVLLFFRVFALSRFRDSRIEAGVVY
jgi:hypothetical protein